MEEKVAVLFFSEPSLPERLCVTAAVRQMGGFTVYEAGSSDNWRTELHQHQTHLMPIFNYYLDCLYLYGISTHLLERHTTGVDFPVINAGSPDAHPVHALSDIACMLRQARYLNNVTAAWVGGDNGTLFSLVAATAWFPFNLRIALPPQSRSSVLETMLDEDKYKAVLTDSAEDALHDVDFVFAGRRSLNLDKAEEQWQLDTKLMNLAKPSARFLLSARPLNAIPVESKLLSSAASLLVRQSEYRLRVHKRLLHWVFAE